MGYDFYLFQMPKPVVIFCTFPEFPNMSCEFLNACLWSVLCLLYNFDISKDRQTDLQNDMMCVKLDDRIENITINIVYTSHFFALEPFIVHHALSIL